MDFVQHLLEKFERHYSVDNTKERRCRYKGCKTKLSQYNRRRYCNYHRELLWQKNPKVKIYIRKTLSLQHRRNIAGSILVWWKKRKNEKKR